MTQPEQFDKFYFAKVGLGEACGCAEKVIDVYELNRQSGAHAKRSVLPVRRKRSTLRSFALKYGLISRNRFR